VKTGVQDLRESIRQVAGDVISMSPERILSAATRLESIAMVADGLNDVSLQPELQTLRRHLHHALGMLADLDEAGASTDLIYSPSGAPEPGATTDVEVHG
jgi:hypothetical protein